MYDPSGEQEWLFRLHERLYHGNYTNMCMPIKKYVGAGKLKYSISVLE